MWGRLATRLAIWLLKESRIGNEERQLLTAAMLAKLGALPIRATVSIDGVGRVYINERPLTLDAAKLLHEGSKLLLKSFARRVVRETVTFMAIKKGVHENVSPEQGLFAKAALWFMQEEESLYHRFAMTEAEKDGQPHTL